MEKVQNVVMRHDKNDRNVITFRNAWHAWHDCRKFEARVLLQVDKKVATDKVGPRASRTTHVSPRQEATGTQNGRFSSIQ
jgi:hypothetical protein